VRFAANAQTLPRLHLIGTLAIVTALTLALAAFFSMRSAADHRDSLERVARTVNEQQQSRLQAELDSAVSYLQFARDRTQDVLRRSLRDQVDTAMQVAQAIYDRDLGRHPLPEVQRLITEALRPVRFYDGRGYYFIDDMQGKFILLPTAPQLEGKTNLDNRDDQGHYIMRGLIQAARKPVGQGYSSYRWYAPDTPTVMADKLAYVRYFAPFDWLIGTGDYTAQWEHVQQQEAIARLGLVRFGHSGYIALIDRQGQLLLPAPGPDGPAISEPQKAALAQLVAKGEQGGGVVRYSWTESNAGTSVAKTALVQRVAPWDWTVVATVNDDELQATLSQELARESSPAQRMSQWMVPLALALLLGLLASYAFSRWSRQFFAMYQSDLLAKSKAIADSEALFHAVFDNAAVGIAQLSPEGLFLQVNQRFCQFLGFDRDEILAKGFTFRQITFPEDLAADTQQAQRLLRGEADSYHLEKRYVTKQGDIVWAGLAVRLVRDAQGQPLYFISAVQDINERKKAEESLLMAASVFTHAREGIMITDLDGAIVNVNDSFSRITGYGHDEVLGQNPRLLKSGLQTAAYYEAMWRSIADQGYWYGEIWNRRKTGEVFAEMQTISAVRDALGQPRYYVSLFSDITALKQHEQQLERIAHFDVLTGLPNRALLADRLQQSMLQAQRRDQLLAVAYLDLDGFKAINDLYGHDAGDRVLMGVASRMKETLREGDTLARIGGDEFVAVLVDLPDVATCQPLLARLLTAAAEPMAFEGHTMQVSASLGVTFFPQAEDMDADQLQRQADQAMYQAKLSGKNRYHLFDAEQDRSARGHFESLEEISRAVTGNELLLYYQPKINMRSGRVVGAEALIRWQHPQRGLLTPAHFLPVIENHAISITVGEWVIHSALRQMLAWHAEGLDLPVSVNVGARQLQQRDFVQRLQGILAQYPDVQPGHLQIEVLETSALEDINGVSQVIAQCHALGVKFALDDFGTGYSSLTYLKQLPVAQLKIDQSFVRDMLDDADDLAILTGVIGLARAFRREVIAEGVETIGHGTALLQLGCELAQGYGIARPMPAADMAAWVASWQPDARWSQIEDSLHTPLG
jgi:diguanylate cyclase (GGDEF)-like protein/PAS domain S-box-containing protein